MADLIYCESCTLHPWAINIPVYLFCDHYNLNEMSHLSQQTARPKFHFKCEKTAFKTKCCKNPHYITMSGTQTLKWYLALEVVKFWPRFEYSGHPLSSHTRDTAEQVCQVTHEIRWRMINPLKPNNF